ncbi:APC family permease [Thermoplasma volcanium]|nr:APC family permease [Thermoplasma volcanium]
MRNNSHFKESKIGTLKSNVHGFVDLFALSTSSVAPAFSIAASYGVIAMYLGFHSISAIILVFPVWLASSFIFRKFNRLYPNAGASYHWGNIAVSKVYGSGQSWIITLAYLLSIPPIVIPAGEYTGDLLYSIGAIPQTALSNPVEIFSLGTFWVFVTLVASLLGARPTAKLTELFLAVEVSVIAMFVVIAVMSLHDSVVNRPSISWFIPPIASRNEYVNLLSSLPIIATVLDGWEIDSYASEESVNRERWPGTTGVIGLVLVFTIYVVTMTLMQSEVPIKVLSSSVDPLYAWGMFVAPKYAIVMDLAVIASTASSLWLTTYILSRAWYAMSREGLLPSYLGYLSKTRLVPYVGLILISALAELVNFLMIFSRSIEGFFSVLLSFSGVFLMAEFSMDSLTGIVLFLRNKDLEFRKLYLIVSVLTFVSFTAMICSWVYSELRYSAIFISLVMPALVIAMLERMKDRGKSSVQNA